MTAALYCLAATYITTICVTLYLHRSQAHRSVEFHPVIQHFMRFWLWLTTGMVTKQWVAVHRYHHQKTDSPGDPHSPVIHGIWTVLLTGALLYNKATKNSTMVTKYGKGTPDDFVENWIYTPYNLAGILLLLLFNMSIFGFWGLVVWIVQMIWIPLTAAGIINGLGHWWGYRNHNTNDNSHNICRWAVLIGGEELHNNHHHNPASAKLSHKKGEVDAGWFWIEILRDLKLCTIKNEKALTP